MITSLTPASWRNRRRWYDPVNVTNTNANYQLIQDNNNLRVQNMMINEIMQEAALNKSFISEEYANLRETYTTTTDTAANVGNEDSTEVQFLYGYSDNSVLNGSDETKNNYVYLSGDVTINNYNSWEDIYFLGTPLELDTEGNDVVVTAEEGSLRVTEAKGKLLEFQDLFGNVLMHVCAQNDGDTFDGTTYHEPVVVIGSDEGSSTLIAGDGGSILWGGGGKTDDVLTGGEGFDTFVYNYGEGSDIAFADENDVVNLGSVTFEDIKGIKFDDEKVIFVFNDFGCLNVMGRAGEFDINGQKYTANYETKTFEAKADDSDSDE